MGAAFAVFLHVPKRRRKLSSTIPCNIKHYVCYFHAAGEIIIDITVSFNFDLPNDTNLNSSTTFENLRSKCIDSVCFWLLSLFIQTKYKNISKQWQLSKTSLTTYNSLFLIHVSINIFCLLVYHHKYIVDWVIILTLINVLCQFLYEIALFKNLKSDLMDGEFSDLLKWTKTSDEIPCKIKKKIHPVSLVCLF